MQKYEYATAIYGPSTKQSIVNKELTEKFGKEGWKLETSVFDSHTREVTLFFSRPIID